MKSKKCALLLLLSYLVSFYDIFFLQDKVKMAVLCVFFFKQSLKTSLLLGSVSFAVGQNPTQIKTCSVKLLFPCYDVNSSASCVSFVIRAFPFFCTIILNLPLYFLFSSSSLKNALAFRSPWHFRVFVRDLGQRLSHTRFFRYPHLSTQSSEITTALKADNGLFVLSQHKAGLHVW